MPSHRNRAGFGWIQGSEKSMGKYGFNIIGLQINFWGLHGRFMVMAHHYVMLHIHKHIGKCCQIEFEQNARMVCVSNRLLIRFVNWTL